MKNFDFRLRHLLVIGVLILSFSLSAMVRSQAADYGFELNEFDPFFNYRATEYLVANGLDSYLNWHDDKSWYPHGRDVSGTSQVMLHVTAAAAYHVFGGDMSLYDFTILFPVVFGSFTAIVIFALTRVIGGTSAGLFAAMLFAVAVPVIVRGTIGWFKSEPLGLFYGLLGVYLFLSGIKSDNKKIAAIKLVSAGIILAWGLSAWGGIQFFAIPLGMFFIALPFLRKDHKFLLWAIPLFTVSLLGTVMLFERPGLSFVAGIGGFALAGTSVISIACIIVMRFSKEALKMRNGLLMLTGTMVAGFILLVVNETFAFIRGASFRYLNALNPFLTTEDPLTDSVAEHATTTLQQSFYFLSILMIFAGIGIWLIFRTRQINPSLRSKNDMIVFALLIGIVGVYISSAFIRLEIFASISVIILSSVGLSVLASEIFATRKIGKKLNSSVRPITKIAFVIIIVGFLISPTIFPQGQTWIHAVKAPPTLLNGGTSFLIATDDWPDAMKWLTNSTDPDSVVAAWWDYGYWITTLSNRTSVADNATIMNKPIEKVAKTFLSSPDEGWHLLREMEADYFLIYLAAQKIQTEPLPLYILSGGGDESKKQWFMRIAGEDLELYLESDNFSGTDHFWDNTLLGQMIPFSVLAYVNLANYIQVEKYTSGFTPIYELDVKYPEDGDGPLQLAYMSPSMHREAEGAISGVIIYKVNKDYTPLT